MVIGQQTQNYKNTRSRFIDGVGGCATYYEVYTMEVIVGVVLIMFLVFAEDSEEDNEVNICILSRCDMVVTEKEEG